MFEGAAAIRPSRRVPHAGKRIHVLPAVAAATLLALTAFLRVSGAAPAVRAGLQHAVQVVTEVTHRPAAAPRADWTTYGGGVGNPFSATGSAVTARSVARMRLAWYAALDGEVSGNPIAVGGQVFAGTTNGSLYALDRDSGSVLWRTSLDGSPIDGGALYDGGRLFVATSGGRVYALDPATGRAIWSTGVLFGDLKDALRASPRAYGGVIYESLGGTDDDVHEQGGVAAIDAADGHVVWKTMLVDFAGGGAAVFSPPAVIPELGEVVVATGNPTPFPGNFNKAADAPLPAGELAYSDSVVALSAVDGRILWSAQTHPRDASDADFMAAPNVWRLPDGRIAVGAGEKDGSYYAFDARTGRALWSTDLTAPHADTLVMVTAAVLGSQVFVGTMDVPTTAMTWPEHYQAPAAGHLAALDARDGRILWSLPLPSTVDASPVAGPGVVVAALADGTLIAADAATGRVAWRAAAPGQIWNAEAGLALAGDTLLVPLTQPGGGGGVAAYRVP